MRYVLPLVAGLAFASPAMAQHDHDQHGETAAAHASAINPALTTALADTRRDKDRPRDIWRNPGETLGFFGVAPDMKVGEYAPGGGWYSRLLGLYLGPQGKLVGLYTMPANPARQQAARDAAVKFPADVASWSGQPANRFASLTLDAVPEGEKGTYDRILVIRMMHNMLRANSATGDFKAMGDLLKPGGMIGIVQHRAKADAPDAYVDGSKGYLREADVIKFMETNGFELISQSEINANPADPANWPGGVWTLPPTLRKGDVDRARYQAIGESDRMTLLFRKRG